MVLNVTTRTKEKGIFTICPQGSITANTFMVLAVEVDAILKQSPKLIIFDMKDVDYISSAGVTTVLEAEKSMKERGGRVLMVLLQPSVRKVFDLVQILPQQRIFKSIEELDNYLMEIQRELKEEKSN